MLVADPLMVTLVKPVQPWSKLFEIIVTEVGIERMVMLVHP